jgi:hypothetical protein
MNFDPLFKQQKYNLKLKLFVVVAAKPFKNNNKKLYYFYYTMFYDTLSKF